MRMLLFQQGCCCGLRGVLCLAHGPAHGPHALLFACVAAINAWLVEAVCMLRVQFPDPHFKNKHKKRRVVQPELVQAVAAHMPPGGERFAQALQAWHQFAKEGRASYPQNLPKTQANHGQTLHVHFGTLCAMVGCTRAHIGFLAHESAKACSSSNMLGACRLEALQRPKKIEILNRRALCLQAWCSCSPTWRRRRRRCATSLSSPAGASSTHAPPLRQK